MKCQAYTCMSFLFSFLLLHSFHLSIPCSIHFFLHPFSQMTNKRALKCVSAGFKNPPSWFVLLSMSSLEIYNPRHFPASLLLLSTPTRTTNHLGLYLFHCVWNHNLRTIVCGMQPLCINLSTTDYKLNFKTCLSSFVHCSMSINQLWLLAQKAKIRKHRRHCYNMSCVSIQNHGTEY